MPDDEKFTTPRKCEHCGNVSPMQILFKHSIYKHQYETIEDHTYCRTDEDIYNGLLCPACKQVVLQVLHTSDDIDPDDWFTRTLYPQPETIGKYLPKAINSAYEAAGKVRRIDANAYAVLLGRVVEIICQDRQAKGESLHDKLQDLADRGEIPARLVDMAHGLRQLRNVGAHADLGELNASEIPVLMHSHAQSSNMFIAHHACLKK